LIQLIAMFSASDHESSVTISRSSPLQASPRVCNP
jgi:hypothetical protein